MPLLTRMVATPLAVDIGPGAVQALAPLLADRRISSGGHVAVAVGPFLGEELAATLRPQLENAEFFTVEGGTLVAARQLAEDLRGGAFDALVGIGGGRTLDVAKYAATLTGLPLVAVATNLAHDGIASPVSSLVHDGHKGSYGVQMPMAIVVDLDYVRRSEARMRRSGIGDAVSNLSAIADWRLAEQARGEPVDGVAATFAHTAAAAIVHREDGIDDDPFLVALAEALVLSGLAMATAGSSRPCSGGEHEILHAIDVLFPESDANHGELAGACALFAAFLRGNEAQAALLDRCLSHHRLPRTPRELGLDEDQFTQAVLRGPSTRPDRYTILEHLDLDERGARSRIDAYVAAFDS
ncbi:MAG TPA: iron-containing alcohol dehydrogenase family protein [Thermoleophilaceae bacterium]|nr:iron-containing alcohol dehydrogenase family protein [Thermoleophilaceae bacterium]